MNKYIKKTVTNTIITYAKVEVVNGQLTTLTPLTMEIENVKFDKKQATKYLMGVTDSEENFIVLSIQHTEKTYKMLTERFLELVTLESPVINNTL